MEVQKRKQQPKFINNDELVLKKHVGLIHCENKLTLIQRKICNILLFNALDQINQKDIHEISLKNLCCLIGYNSNDVELVKKALKSLISIVMEWNLLEDNKISNDMNLPSDALTWNASSLLAGASIYKGLIKYSYSPQIKSVLSSIDIYGRINLFVQSKFVSCYSLVLYENCVRFKRINRTSWLKLELFRTLMGISKGKYASFKELKRNVITVAMNEINTKSDIRIEAQYRKVGRQITAVQFLIYDNEKYKAFMKPPAKTSAERPETFSSRRHQLQDQLQHDFLFSSVQTNQILNEFTEDYLQEKIKLVRNKKNIKNHKAYLMAALKENYNESSLAKSAAKLAVVPQQPVEAVTKPIDEPVPLKPASFRQKYMIYRFNAYKQSVFDLPKDKRNVIISIFEKKIAGTSDLLARWRKQERVSPVVMMEFMNFIDEQFSNIIKSYLSFEEFITEEIVPG